MTRFLASVRNVFEAEIALANDADIIDLKNPASGALGAADIHTLEQVVQHVAGRRPISATIGDLPMHAKLVHRAVSMRFAAGADYVKIGLFPGGDLKKTLLALNGEVNAGHPIVAVLFADLDPQMSLLPLLAEAGLAGAMLDTAMKQSGRLSDHVSQVFLSEFIQRSHDLGLLCGLAGSLRQEDVPHLLPLKPDYLGFRGALCRDGRTSAIDGTLAREISALVKRAGPREIPAQRSMPDVLQNDTH